MQERGKEKRATGDAAEEEVEDDVPAPVGGSCEEGVRHRRPPPGGHPRRPPAAAAAPPPPVAPPPPRPPSRRASWRASCGWAWRAAWEGRRPRARPPAG